jgi:hypothetical protein
MVSWVWDWKTNKPPVCLEFTCPINELFILRKYAEEGAQIHRGLFVCLAHFSTSSHRSYQQSGSWWHFVMQTSVSHRHNFTIAGYVPERPETILFHQAHIRLCHNNWDIILCPKTPIQTVKIVKKTAKYYISASCCTMYKLEYCSDSYPSLCNSIKIRWVSMFLLSALFHDMFRPNRPSSRCSMCLWKHLTKGLPLEFTTSTLKLRTKYCVFLPRSWRQFLPPKRQYPPTRPHDVFTHKTKILWHICSGTVEPEKLPLLANGSETTFVSRQPPRNEQRNNVRCSAVDSSEATI